MDIDSFSLDSQKIIKEGLSAKKTSSEWAKDCEFDILDPDGWNRRNFQYSFYEELITKEEFNRRLFSSTVMSRPT